MAQAKVLYGQSIFDIANNTGYTIDYVVKLMLENTFITSVNYDFNANPGQSLEYDNTFKVKAPQILTQSPLNTTSGQRSLRAMSNQTIFDLAIESIGMDKVVQLMTQNNIANINTVSLQGVVFNFNASDIPDVGFYKNGLKITTGINVTTYPAPPFLLQEDGTLLLQEDGTGIILE